MQLIGEKIEANQVNAGIVYATKSIMGSSRFFVDIIAPLRWSISKVKPAATPTHWKSPIILAEHLGVKQQKYIFIIKARY